MLTVCMTALTDVNGYIENSSFYTTYEFTLGEWMSLEMQASHHAIARHAFVVLNKINLAHLFLKFSLRKTFEEIATSILEHSWFDDYNTLNCGLYYIHINRDLDYSFLSVHQ